MCAHLMLATLLYLKYIVHDSVNGIILALS